jgi:hypothetical protein
MIEFTPGARQVHHLTRNYFPIVTREPYPDMYVERSQKNPSIDADVAREAQIRKNLFTFFALSELALITMASFGKPHEARNARREMSVRHAIRSLNTVARMPYSMSAVSL